MSLFNRHRTIHARRRCDVLACALAIALLPCAALNCSPSATDSFNTRLEDIHALLDRGQDKEAEQAARALLADVEASQMPALRLADVLDVLGIALQRQRRMSEDETWEFARRALRIREEHGLPDDTALVTSLRNLGELHMSAGEFEEAMQRYSRALGILEQAPDADPTLMGACQTDIAIVHSVLGRYDQAIDGYERALASHAAAPRPDELQMAMTLNGLGLVLFEIGDFVGCRARHEQALEIRERLLKPNHPKIAETLNNFGAMLLEERDHSKALEYFTRVVRIRVLAYGPQHRLVGRALNNRASAELETGDPAGAKSTARQALAILEKHQHAASIAGCLVTLGGALRELGEYEEARTCYERSRAIREGLGYSDPYLIVTLKHLATLRYETGDLQAARESIERSVALCVELLSSEHPLLATYEALHATILAELGEHQEAFEAAARAEAVRSGHLRITSQALSEREALLYSESQERGLDVLLQLASNGVGPSETAVRRTWDARIRSRAIVLDEMVARSRRAVLSSDPDVGNLVEEYRQASKRYGNLALRGARGMNLERYRKLLTEALNSKEKIERALSNASRSFATDLRRAALGFDETSQHLPRGSALVAYVTYTEPKRPALPDKVDFETDTFRRPEKTRKIAALVLRGGEHTPHIVALGTQAEVERRVRQWGTEAALGVAVAGRSHADTEAAYGQVGERLRQVIWDPIRQYLGGANLVFVIPDGSVHRVALSALPSREGRFLADEGIRFHYLTSERDLVPASEDRLRGAGLLAVGGVSFGGPTNPRIASASSATRTPATRPPTAHRGSTPCVQFDQVEFPELPATADEAHDVVALWRKAQKASSKAPSEQPTSTTTTRHGDAALLTGAQATDVAFRKHASGKRVLHLATHGFFLDDECAASPADTRGLKHTGAASRAKTQPHANPLLLSGLAFGGANRHNAVAAGEDDGILIAEEIAALDLQGVEWAVLSACETGIGTVVSGEGVLGLRRAFQVAGVQSLIMSLWAVGDEPTREWMHALYSARLLEARPTADAVHQANKKILEARRERGKSCDPCGECSTHPFYWASFVAAGNWR